MELVGHPDPDRDDLPLRANTNHILVRHYVLNLTVHFDTRVIGGNIVLFLEPVSKGKTEPGENTSVAGDVKDGVAGRGHPEPRCQEVDTKKDVKAKGSLKSSVQQGHQTEGSGNGNEMTNNVTTVQTSDLWNTTSSVDFTLVLDCCNLVVSKVEEVDVASITTADVNLPAENPSDISDVPPSDLNTDFIQSLFCFPSSKWRLKHKWFSLISRAPGCEDGSSLHFCRDIWSLQVRKKGASTPFEFPRVIRIFYKTEPIGGSMRWTTDQDNRLCVYTAGSPINNRALFPCQEPPVAMSTWQATIRAPSECVVLSSGEEPAVPTSDGDGSHLIWSYYVTMPMPASTFTLAVGQWCQVMPETSTFLETVVGKSTGDGDATKPAGKHGDRIEKALVSPVGNDPIKRAEDSQTQTGRKEQASSSGAVHCHPSPEDEDPTVTDYSAMVNDGTSCSHGDYPCRFTELSAWSQRVIPHRVFSPACLLQKAQMSILRLLPHCLAAARAVLGVHPFSRLDVLIVPAGFSSLGMASPHIVFLSQSVLGSGQTTSPLCGSRICHEISHSWFGLLIGAKDWTEEWISEGFATCLEDIIWAKTQQLSSEEREEQQDLKALLRWRRLADEVQNSKEELQILRPNMEKTGQVSDSGSSAVKHALNPEKTFMQVHYLKGYFLLRFLASEVGEEEFVDFLRLFVRKYHGHLVLSQDFLQMLLITFPDLERKNITLSAIYADWLDQPGIPKWLRERSAVWSQSRLVGEVREEVIKWIQFSRSHQGKGRKRKRPKSQTGYKEFTADQLVLLLELLLEESQLSTSSMSTLQKTYDLQRRDAEVQHRWCELVVKHAHARAYADVEYFLVHNQAMGVYLYGELMLQEDPEQQALARRCLSLVAEHMDSSARRVVEEMIL